MVRNEKKNISSLFPSLNSLYVSILKETHSSPAPLDLHHIVKSLKM